MSIARFLSSAGFARVCKGVFGSLAVALTFFITIKSLPWLWSTTQSPAKTLPYGTIFIFSAVIAISVTAATFSIPYFFLRKIKNERPVRYLFNLALTTLALSFGLGCYSKYKIDSFRIDIISSANDFLTDGQFVEAQNKYTESIRTLLGGKSLSAKYLAQDLDATKERTKQARADLEDLKVHWRRAFDRSTIHMRSDLMSRNAVEGLPAFDKGVARTNVEWQQLWADEDGILNDVDAITDTLIQHRSQWSVRESKILFTSEGILEGVQAHAADLVRLDEDAHQLQTIAQARRTAAESALKANQLPKGELIGLVF